MGGSPNRRAKAAAPQVHCPHTGPRYGGSRVAPTLGDGVTLRNEGTGEPRHIFSAGWLRHPPRSPLSTFRDSNAANRGVP